MKEQSKSLHEVNATVDPHSARGKWKKIFAFFGPAYLVSVGYMDPGNWATDIAGGSKFGYSLLWVLLMSNLMALLLQSLSARLGIVQGRDLAQCSRDLYPPFVNFVLYILAEIAIAACDLAEVLGMAIGLKLLFNLPLIAGVTFTLLDTILLLYLQKLGIRKMEAFIVSLVAIIGISFLTEIILSGPSVKLVATGLLPTLPGKEALYIAIGIIGATVMPHNLYLHSALVQTRKIGNDKASIKRAIRYNTVDSAIALNLAFFVNASILILAGTVFYTTGNTNVETIEHAHKLLAPLLGSKWAAILFAVALVASGQSSTITGTLAGQIIMEGYLDLRLSPAARRLLTRSLAIVPAVIVIMISGEQMVDEMLVFSQVLLSMQLGFAIIPLIHFVSDKRKMGDFVIRRPVQIASWVIASVILVLNIKLFGESLMQWLGATDNVVVQVVLCAVVAFIGVILLYTIIYPIMLKRVAKQRSVHAEQELSLNLSFTNIAFKRVALALDFSSKDQKVIEYALRLARPETTLVLVHIVESASARVMGNEADDFETVHDRKQLDAYVQQLAEKGINAMGVLGFKNRIEEITRIVNEEQCDLLLMGSHGHRTAKDWLLGETINTVRHRVSVPVFIAQ